MTYTAFSPRDVDTAVQAAPAPVEILSANVVHSSFCRCALPRSLEAKYLDREVLNVDELAEILRMEERLVYASIKRGEIPGVRRFGKRGIIRISRRVFFDWLHRRGAS